MQMNGPTVAPQRSISHNPNPNSHNPNPNSTVLNQSTAPSNNRTMTKNEDSDRGRHFVEEVRALVVALSYFSTIYFFAPVISRQLRACIGEKAYKEDFSEALKATRRGDLSQLELASVFWRLVCPLSNCHALVLSYLQFVPSSIEGAIRSHFRTLAKAANLQGFDLKKVSLRMCKREREREREREK
jgi:hypothetical protein